MKTIKGILLAFSCIHAIHSVKAQGNFQNLDFEAASLTAIPAGQFGGAVSSTAAIPGWIAFIGSNQATEILHNNYTLGNASIDILGPNWGVGDGIIEGRYTVVLQPGFVPFSSEIVGASISQIGFVPAGALSIQLKALAFSSFAVSLDGQYLSLIPLATGPNYTLYGADISSYGGKVAELAITALPANNTTIFVDSIAFSSLPVPEPGTLVLFGFGLFFLGLLYCRRHG